jgi:hypothetical protein
MKRERTTVGCKTYVGVQEQVLPVAQGFTRGEASQELPAEYSRWTQERFSLRLQVPGTCRRRRGEIPGEIPGKLKSQKEKAFRSEGPCVCSHAAFPGKIGHGMARLERQ